MARISGVDLNDKWKLDYALTRIRGIGWTTSQNVVKAVSLEPKMKVSDLTSNDIKNIGDELEKYMTEGDLIRKIREDIQRLREIGTYRGIRHNRNLPVRGQRTKSNARTNRGKRRTVGSYKKEDLAKMTSNK